MKHLKNYLIKNDYIRATAAHHLNFETVFTKSLGSQIDATSSAEILCKKFVISGILNYPVTGFQKDSNIFQYITTDVLSLMKQKKCFFIFDASAEGFSAYYDNLFHLLYYNCEKYNVDPSYVIFTSSNLKDEEVHINYCIENNVQNPIHVISLPYFSTRFDVSMDANNEFEKTIKNTECNYSTKFFSSLNRYKRNERSMAQFLISHNKIKQYSLQSQNKLEENEIHLLANTLSVKFPDINYKKIKQWNEQLPMIVDRKDFKINWAIHGEFHHIHDQTLFQLVNETWVTNFNDTSIFYSEKTFRPIYCFQPFIIFGQQGCNRYLENLGYKCYDEWFDYDFDDEADDLERLVKTIKVLEDTCVILSTLNRNQQIEWKFKNKEILLHNYNTMRNQEYSKNKVKELVLKLIEQVKKHK